MVFTLTPGIRMEGILTPVIHTDGGLVMALVVADFHVGAEEDVPSVAEDAAGGSPAMGRRVRALLPHRVTPLRG